MASFKYTTKERTVKSLSHRADRKVQYTNVSVTDVSWTERVLALDLGDLAMLVKALTVQASVLEAYGMHQWDVNRLKFLAKSLSDLKATNPDGTTPVDETSGAGATIGEQGETE